MSKQSKRYFQNLVGSANKLAQCLFAHEDGFSSAELHLVCAARRFQSDGGLVMVKDSCDKLCIPMAKGSLDLEGFKLRRWIYIGGVLISYIRLLPLQ